MKFRLTNKPNRTLKPSIISTSYFLRAIETFFLDQQTQRQTTMAALLAASNNHVDVENNIAWDSLSSVAIGNPNE